MPEISSFFGIMIKMYFNEHYPPHFHLEYQNYTAIIISEDATIKDEMLQKQRNVR